jgi:hypothetical protein
MVQGQVSHPRSELVKLGDLNFTAEEEAQVVREQFREACLIFETEAMEGGDPVMCHLHNVFGTFDTSHHNCLGCNFADSTQLILSFLRTYELQDTIQYAYSTFIILASLFVERIYTLFRFIHLDNTCGDERFKTLLEIRTWANFVKHPKAFFLTHHPSFSFDGSPRNRNLGEHACVVIDHCFVENYYKSEARNKELYERLENKQNVLVIYPDVVRLVRALCECMHNCVTLICDNPKYLTALKDRATFENYWIDA